MSIIFKRYKRLFRLRLQPVLAVLVEKRTTMNQGDWETMVRKTMDSIAKKPVEYLGQNLPSESYILNILEDIENEFLKDMHFRSQHR